MRWLLGCLMMAFLCGCGRDEPGTKRLESGLKYRDISEGEGEAAKKGDDVAVLYVGKLRNGKMFDASDRDKPFEFRLGAGVVIKGWDEGVVGMKIGGKRKLIIPADLGYGSRGADKAIPPDSELHFEVEMVDINGVKSTRPHESAADIKYRDVKVGEGEAAKKGDKIGVRYVGRFKSGKTFDASEKDTLFCYTLGEEGIKRGWDAAVAGMKLGGKRKLVVPAKLARDAKGAPPDAPGDEELTFDVELADLNDAAKSEFGIEDLRVGTGQEAKVGDTVEMHYTGWLKNGTKFDSSLDRGRPFVFRLGVGEVIKGWDRGVPGMKVGGRRKLIIPPDLGYGARGFPPDIPPGAELHFEVELLKVR